MSEAEVAALVALLRRTGFEPSDVEVKAAAGGLPRSIPETLSAFANGAGGTVILGLDETAGFLLAEGFDALAIRDAVVDACIQKVTPPLRAPVDVVAVDDAVVVCVEVDELDPVDKPCFVTARGDYGGSFIRGDDGDRRLSRYEVSQLLSNRTQPVDDCEPVERATVDDLDQALLDGYLVGIRDSSTRLAALPREELLTQLDVLVHTDSGVLRPTLAGLLCFGTYPQQFLPQLFVAVVALPGLTMGETDPEGSRFLDNQRLTGPIPIMVDDAVRAVMRNMRRAAIIKGLGRRDRYDYPLDVIRELVVNAIMHRDYSAESRGAQVQVEIYPDRLGVRSPGGLYGPIHPDVLGMPEQRSTSRNNVLAAMLSEIDRPERRGEKICENRGSGLRAVMSSLRSAGMSPPEFRVAPDAVDVVVLQQSLLGPEVIEWIGGLGETGLSDHQHLALAMMRTAGSTSSARLRTWGVDRVDAGIALRDLVARQLAVKNGGRRYATYRLPDVLPTRTGQMPLNLDASREVRLHEHTEPVLTAIGAGHVTARAVAEVTGLHRRAVARRLDTLITQGLVERIGAPRSPQQSYRLTRPQESP